MNSRLYVVALLWLIGVSGFAYLLKQDLPVYAVTELLMTFGLVVITFAYKEPSQ